MTIRSGDRTVLLVVDVQKGAVASAYNRDAVVANIGEVVRKAREKKVPVLWVQHEDDELVPKSEAWEIVGELEVGDDVRIGKRYNSAFEETELEAILDRLRATRIVLVGAATNWCIRATAYGALDRGYDLTLISDAHTTNSIEMENGERLEAKAIIDDLNIAMAWLRYPGRTNRAIRTDELVF